MDGLGHSSSFITINGERVKVCMCNLGNPREKVHNYQSIYYSCIENGISCNNKEQWFNWSVHELNQR